MFIVCYGQIFQLLQYLIYYISILIFSCWKPLPKSGIQLLKYPRCFESFLLIVIFVIGSKCRQNALSPKQ